MEEIKIGNQIWMKHNLDVDTFQNGDAIIQAKTNGELILASENKHAIFCYYDNNPKYGEKYKKLYNWYSVNDPRGLAPVGWRIPTLKDWEILLNYLNGGSYLIYNKNNYSITESLRIEDENNIDWSGNNKSGFRALPAGWFDIFDQIFNDLGTATVWWSNKETFDENGNLVNAWSVCLTAEKKMNLVFSPFLNKGCCLSIRCIKII